MEDQFGGRTDDDLFYDDFEPVEGETVVTEAPPQQPSSQPPASQKTSTQQAQPSASPEKISKGLMSSRYADPQPTPEPPAPAPTTATKPEPEPQSQPEQQQPPSQPPPSDGPPPNAPTAPKEKRQQGPSGHNNASHNKDNAADREARLQSGANPRQKLTDAELSQKMEQMKLLSAEKTRKFEKAEQDEKQHAQAYARGMQEARKRQVEADERRRRGEENQRQLNTEREKNRERKLKAMSLKEGGWDEGKDAVAQEEARRTFKGSNGGVRGSRRGGLGGGRVLQEGEELPDVDRFLDDRYRQRGRGRGRGGRGGSERGGRPAGPAAQTAKQAVPKSEDFPALPPSSNKETDSGPKPVNPEPILSPLPKGGKWDDEMEALDALEQKP